MSYTYINRKKRGYYATFDERLDSNYAQGSTYEDFQTGNPAPWVPLSAEQVAFHEENPTATVKEVLDMAIDPAKTLREAKSLKLREVSQAREALRTMTLDDEEIYAQPYERREALMSKAMNGAFVMRGKTWDEFEGKAVVNAMDSYDASVDEVYRAKSSEVNEAGSVEDVNAVSATEGYPEPIALVDAQLKVMGNELRRESPEAVSVTFSKRFINDSSLAITSEEALTFKSIYPIWGEEYAEFGKEVETGFRCRVVKRDGNGGKTSDILYEAIQPHTLQENWEPGLSTASLYKSIDVDHAGTIGDPIPFTPPMTLHNGKYYIESEIKYLCNEDSVIPLNNTLAELAVSGRYVAVVN